MSSQNSWSSSVSRNNKNGGKEKLTKMENMKMGVKDFLGPLTRQQMSNILPESIPIKAVNDLGRKSWLLLSADTVDFWNIDLKQGIPAMNVCLSASSKLYCLLEKLSKDGKRNIEPAVKWQNFGIFNRESIRAFIKIHEYKTVRQDIVEENKWLQDFLSVCVGEETLKDVQMFLDDIQHTLSTSLLDGGISVRALSRLPCDRWLSEDLIAHCFNKLNKLASEDEFIVFSEDLMVDTVKFRNSLSQMSASEKSIKRFHFAINTRKDGSGRNLITSSGIHWAYLCCDLSQNDCVYGDSLAYPLPSNIALLLDPLKAELRNICKGTNKPFNLNPRILYDHGNYEPFCRWKTLFPLQTCGTICGTIPIIISALCVDKFQLWQQLLNQSPITENNRKRLSFITRPSQHAEVIRASIISWIVRDEFRASMVLCDNNKSSYVRTSSKVGGRSVDHRKRYHASDEDFPPFPTKTAKVESGYKQETLSKSVPSMEDPKSANTPLSLNETVLATPAIKSVMKDAKIENSWKHGTLSENGPVTRDPKSGDIPLDFSEFFVAGPASKPVEKDAMTFEFSPLPYLSKGWYYQRGRVVASNEARDALRQSQPAASDDKEKLISLRRGEKTGSLADNLTEIHCKMRKSHPARKTQQLIAVKAVGEHLLKHGPLIKTQDAIQIYREKALVEKETSEVEDENDEECNKRRTMSASFLETISKHLNVFQVYIRGTGYIAAFTDQNAFTFLQTIEELFNSSKIKIINDHIEEQIGAQFNSVLQLLTAKSDRDLLNAIMEKVTSVSFLKKLKRTSDSRSIRNSRDEMPEKLKRFEDIKRTSRCVRNDMTGIQQYHLEKRVISQRKMKMLKSIAAGRGRHMKATEFPELAKVLEMAFGDGAQIHPRLTETTLYKATDNCFTMAKARQIILAVAPPGFQISLSACYNYTQNFKSGTYEARRHHEGKGVNANISLHKIPRIGSVKSVVNVHYAAKGVALVLEEKMNQQNESLVDAKDAKGIVCADIDPVQTMGKSWRRINRLDHQWNQSRENAVTPMTHLFLKTKEEISVANLGGENYTALTHSGKVVTLVNPSFFEPETAYRCFNEILYLLTLPSLDHLLRNPHTGKLKTKFVFDVDNGPSEAPSSPLVQMLMVRMLKFLKLEKCTTVSYAEFNSKMNPGERPHAEENRVLSCHGPYSSKLVHGNAVVGSKEHLQNMEAMAREVISTIKEATFGGKKLEAYHGITDADYVFRDEETLKVFLSLSEQNKEEFEETYSPSFSSSILESIARNWNIDKNYSSSYVDDYEHLNNTLKQDERTSWIEKYRAVFYNSAECINLRRYEFQPVPDYVCWARTQELHYLPLSLMKELSFGPWSQEAGLFLPTRILSMLMRIFPDPEAQLIHFFSFLSWVSEEKVKECLKQSQEKLDDEMFEEKLRDQWKDHKLYKKTKEELEKDALALGIEVSKASKARLVEKIANKKHIEEPPFIEYNRNLRSVPNNLTELSKLSTGVLRRILKYHNITKLAGSWS